MCCNDILSELNVVYNPVLSKKGRFRETQNIGTSIMRQKSKYVSVHEQTQAVTASLTH